MTRPRVPARFAVAQIVLHSLSLGFSIAAIGVASYVATIGFGYGGAMAGTLVAAFLAVGLNIAEVTGLADAKKKRVRRLPGLFLVIAEVLTAVLCIVLPLVVYGAASFSHGCNLDAPLTDCPNGELILPANRSSLAFIFIITTAVLHGILAIMACIQWMRNRRRNS